MPGPPKTKMTHEFRFGDWTPKSSSENVTIDAQGQKKKQYEPSYLDSLKVVGKKNHAPQMVVSQYTPTPKTTMFGRRQENHQDDTYFSKIHQIPCVQRPNLSKCEVVGPNTPILTRYLEDYGLSNEKYLFVQGIYIYIKMKIYIYILFRGSYYPLTQEIVMFGLC